MAERIIIDLEAKTDKALKGITELKSQLNQLNTEAKKQNKGVETSFKKVERATQMVSNGIKTIGTTLKAIGIGLIISSLANLKELFSQNQKVVDVFNIAFETTAQVVGQVATAFVDTYNALTQSTDQLDALGKVASSILTIVLSPFQLAFYGISKAIDEAMLAWENSFLGDKDPETIKALNLSILETKKNILEIADGVSQAGSDIVNNFGEAITEVSEIGKVVVKEFGEVSISTAKKAAKANVELQKSAELAAARQGLFFEKFDRQAEKLRQIRDDETKSIEERKKANDELLLTIDSAEASMLSQAQMQLALADANLKKDKENIQFQTARIEALRELAGVEAQIEGIRSEQKANALTLDRDSLELTNSIIQADAELNANKNQFEAEQIENDLARLERQKLLNEEETKSEEKRLTEKRDLYKKGTIAFQEAQNELNAYQQASGQKQVLIEKQIAKEKEKTVLNTLGAIAGLLGSNSKFGKALAITQALRDTYAGANKALAQGGIFGFIGAAGVIASGIANVKQITSSKDPATPSFATGGGGVSASTPPTPPTPSLPPAFNVVGASDTNQLAEAIGSQSQQPVQAFVVSNDVSTAQELDRNIIEGASIG